MLGAVTIHSFPHFSKVLSPPYQALEVHPFDTRAGFPQLQAARCDEQLPPGAAEICFLVEPGGK